MHKSPFTDNIGCVSTRAREQQERGIKSMPVLWLVLVFFFPFAKHLREYVFVVLHPFYRCICFLSFIFFIRHISVGCVDDMMDLNKTDKMASFDAYFNLFIFLVKLTVLSLFLHSIPIISPTPSYASLCL